MPKIETNTKILRNFSLGASVFFALITGYLYYKNKIDFIPYMGSVSGIFLFFGIVKPELSKPIYIAWMSFAHILGQINTKIILLLVFILTVVPVSLFLKLFRKDILDKKLDKEKTSYWNQKETKEFKKESYERHF
jgi:cytochrome b subunit of formate dehydrogenase